MNISKGLVLRSETLLRRKFPRLFPIMKFLELVDEVRKVED